jgi:sialate O-acetylesterase
MKYAVRHLPLLVVLLQPCLVRADVRLPSIISEHMVLAKSESVPIWGEADANEEVTITLDGKTARTRADSDGKWMVRLNLKESAAGPFQLVVQGKNEIRVPDVVVGVVWLASGQSNMEFSLKAASGGEDEIARPENPGLRQFRVEKAARSQPACDCKGKWVIAGPKTAGDFTAVGYYFGKRLQETLKAPVGIINASWGGTFSEAWTSIDGINQVEDLKKAEQLRRKLLAEYPAKRKAFVTELDAWLHTTQREDKPTPHPELFAGEKVSPTEWTSVNFPGKIAGAGLPSSGAVWLRKEVDVPEAAVGHGEAFKVLLGVVTGFEQAYWNGTKVSETPYSKYPGEGHVRYFEIPPDRVRVGTNTLAVRIYAPVAPPEIVTSSERFWAGPVSLVGRWFAKAEYEFPPLEAKVLATVPQAPPRPPSMEAGAIFNGVISPIIPYGIDGVIWYQGESNAGRAYDYRVAFPLLIKDWRQKWQQPELPFYFCQLPNARPKSAAPTESEWAELRESQSLALPLPATGQAVLIDLGESEDYHPRNKRDVGERLARLALAKQYQQSIAFSGPVFESMKVEGDKIRLKFRHVEGGLAARALPATYDVVGKLKKTAPLVRNSPESELEGFSICEADRRWVWADAKIEGDTVVVWSKKASHPIAVRYAWADNPTCNLENRAGLPASPFRTDDFPAITAKNHFGPGQ